MTNPLRKNKILEVMQGNKDLPNGNAVVKTEPGTSITRLPSLKGRRDLTLPSDPTKTTLKNSILKNSAPAKKTVYTPCLNVQRNRPQVPLISAKQESKEIKQKSNSSDRGGPRRRGRGNLIQLSSGTFEEGRGPSLKSIHSGRSSSGGGGGGGGGDGPSEKAVLQIPKLTKQENIRIDKNEEELMLKELLRDDFVDNPNLEPDYDNCPIKLPLSESAVFRNNNVKKIKTEPGTIEKFTEIKLDADPRVKKEKLEQKIPGMREIMSSTLPQFAMLQLPSCLPGLKPDVETNSRQNQPSSSQSNGPTSSNNNSSTEQSTSKVTSEPRCTLQSLRPGKIGKMQLLKSGRVRLILGDTKLWLEMGTQVSFKQDLISVDLDKKTKTGKTICLGSVPLRMTVTPDWDNLLSKRTVSSS